MKSILVLVLASILAGSFAVLFAAMGVFFWKGLDGPTMSPDPKGSVIPFVISLVFLILATAGVLQVVRRIRASRRLP